MNIILVDIDPGMVDAWSKEIQAMVAGERTTTAHTAAVITCQCVSAFDPLLTTTVLRHGTALATPGNSFGVMSGGFDGVITEHLGKTVQSRVQYQINAVWDGELPVGAALTVAAPTLNKHTDVYDRIIYAPTMRTPRNVANTINAYLAFRAILKEAKYWKVETLVCPGLCTLSGGMDYQIVAKQMCRAILEPQTFNLRYQAALERYLLAGGYNASA